MIQIAILGLGTVGTGDGRRIGGEDLFAVYVAAVTVMADGVQAAIRAAY